MKSTDYVLQRVCNWFQNNRRKKAEVTGLRSPRTLKKRHAAGGKLLTMRQTVHQLYRESITKRMNEIAKEKAKLQWKTQGKAEEEVTKNESFQCASAHLDICEMQHCCPHQDILMIPSVWYKSVVASITAHCYRVACFDGKLLLITKH